MSTKIFVFFTLLSTAFTASVAQHRVGTMFHFIPSVGACGFTNTSDEIVASVPNAFFTTFPGATTNPNKNPLCQRKVLITHGSKNLIAPIVDSFTSNAENDIGLSSAGFVVFGSLDEGVIHNATWSVV